MDPSVSSLLLTEYIDVYKLCKIPNLCDGRNQDALACSFYGSQRIHKRGCKVKGIHLFRVGSVTVLAVSHKPYSEVCCPLVEADIKVSDSPPQQPSGWQKQPLIGLEPKVKTVLSNRRERTMGLITIMWSKSLDSLPAGQRNTDRPVWESRTPVNVGNWPHCDNGRGWRKPAPYPLIEECPLLSYLSSS